MLLELSPSREVATVPVGGLVLSASFRHQATVTRDSQWRWPHVRFRPFAGVQRVRECGCLAAPGGLSVHPYGDDAANEAAPIEDDGGAFYCPVPGTLHVVGEVGWTLAAVLARPVGHVAGGLTGEWTLTHEVTPPEAELPIQRGCVEIYCSAAALLLFHHGDAITTTLAISGGQTLPVGPGVSRISVDRIDPVSLALVRLRGRW